MSLFPPQHTTIDKAHGRIEIRKIWTSSELKGYLDFPYVEQVFRIKRCVSRLNGSDLRTEIVYGITSLREDVAFPERLLALNRGHWEIENRLCWVRDVTFDEDRCQIRKGKGAHCMASLRNLAISLFRLIGMKNIASAIRCYAMYWGKTLSLIGL